jgi:hypothetical protein
VADAEEGATAEPELQINGERLWATLMDLKEIGGYDDAATGLRVCASTRFDRRAPFRWSSSPPGVLA